MFNTVWVRLLVPMLKLPLSWTGTLIRLATGFCVAFCSCSAPASAGLSGAGASDVVEVMGEGDGSEGGSVMPCCARALRLRKRRKKHSIV
jgi:hypothetical protein